MARDRTREASWKLKVTLTPYQALTGEGEVVFTLFLKLGLTIRPRAGAGSPGDTTRLEIEDRDAKARGSRRPPALPLPQRRKAAADRAGQGLRRLLMTEPRRLLESERRGGELLLQRPSAPTSCHLAKPLSRPAPWVLPPHPGLSPHPKHPSGLCSDATAAPRTTGGALPQTPAACGHTT